MESGTGKQPKDSPWHRVSLRCGLVQKVQQRGNAEGRRSAPAPPTPPGGQRWVGLGSPPRYWYLGILTAPSDAAPLQEPQWF